MSTSVCESFMPRRVKVLRPPTWRAESVRPGASSIRVSKSSSGRLLCCSVWRSNTVTEAGAVRASSSLRVAVTVTCGSTACSWFFFCFCAWAWPACKSCDCAAPAQTSRLAAAKTLKLKGWRDMKQVSF